MKKSIVWRFMSPGFDEDNDRIATCNLCQKVFRYKSSTSSLKTHIERFHPDYLEKSYEDVASTTIDIIPRCSPKIRKSIVWKFMTPGFDERNNQTATCNLCHKVYKYNSSTSSLKIHIEKFHPIDLEKLCGDSAAVEIDNIPSSSSSLGKVHSVDKIPSYSSSLNPIHPIPNQGQSNLFNQLNKYRSDSERCKDIEDSLLQFVTMDLQSLSIVEDKGFRHFVNVLDHQYEMISEERLEEKLTISYNDIKQTLENKLKLCDKVSLTIDNWSSHNDETLTTVSVHYLDEHWKLQNSVLLTDYVENLPSGENSVSDIIDKAISQFGLENKVSTLITDDNWNVTDSSIKFKLDATRHHACLAHTLDIVMSTAIDAVEDVKSLIERIQASVMYFWTEIDISKKTKHHTYESHWVKSFESLEYFLSQFDEISAAVCFEANDRQQVGEVIKALQPFYEIALELSSEKITPASKINPIVKVLKKLCGNNQHPLSIQIYNNIVSSFSNVEEDAHLIIATLLDPRYKKSGFFSSDTASKAVDKLRLIIRNDDSPGSLVEFSKLANNDTAEKLEPPKKKSLLWAEFDDEFTRNNQMKCLFDRSAEEQQLGLFLDMPVISREDNPFDWWNFHQFRFSNLVNVAKEFLSIPATSIPSCQVFSKERNSKHLRRALLNRSNVNMMTFLSQNQQ